MSDADSVDLGWGAAAEVKASSTPAALWQVNTRGRKVVEMTLAELAQSVKAGKISARTLVWSDGMAEWAPIGQVPVLLKLTQTDSEPPPSGARPIEEMQAGTKAYASSGSEPPTDPGTLAIYARPLATIEFPTSDEPPESVEEATPAFGLSAKETSAPPAAAAPPVRPAAGAAPSKPAAVSQPKAAPTAPLPKSVATSPAPKASSTPLPKPAARDGERRKSLVDMLEAVPASALREEDPPAPPLPPLPPRGKASFPAPVTASPLAAALSSTVGPVAEPAAAAMPPAPFPPAKSSPLASAAPLIAPSPARSTPVPAAALATPARSTPVPAAVPSSSARTTPVSTPMPAVDRRTEPGLAPPPSQAALAPTIPFDPPPPPLPVLERPPTVSPPRPAIEFLPPIIVQEKEDDGTSLLNLPLEPEHHESTIVLSGRRRARRWVPLNAAVAGALGAACLASALTALVVRAPAPVTRVVEKRVLVPAPPSEATAAADPPRAAPASTANEASASAASDGAPSKPSAPGERTASTSSRKGETSGTVSTPPREWRRDDPGTLDAPASPPRRELRAGFPTNPGF